MLKIQALSPVFAVELRDWGISLVIPLEFHENISLSYGTANFFGKKAPSDGAPYKKRESSQILSC